LKIGSLFSGIGGFDLGFERAGHETVWQVEKEPYRLDVLRNHWPDVRRFDDIETFDPTDAEPVDCITAGFPCQDITITTAGRRGIEGERSILFWEIARCLGAIQPRWVVIENVAGLFSSNDGRDFVHVTATLQALGYGVSWNVFNSRHFGVPQSRRRLFIVGRANFGVEGAGAVLVDSEGGAGTTAPSGETRNTTAVLSGKGGQEVAGTVSGKWLKGSGGPSGDEAYNLAVQDGRVRRLLPVECERLQGFPDDWTHGSDPDRYKALGDAVTVPVAEYIGHRLAGWDAFSYNVVE